MDGNEEEKTERTEEEVVGQCEGKFSVGYARRNALKQGGKVRIQRFRGWNERCRGGWWWLLETVKRGRDLVGLVPAKEPRPLGKTFGLLFTPLNIRSRRCMNGYVLVLAVSFLRHCSLSLFEFEI